MDSLTDPQKRRAAWLWRSTLARALRRSLLHRHFALLWTGQTISSFGSHITSLALPLAALLLLQATPAQIGLLTALGALPGLLLGLFLGVWIDRLPRRPLLIAADLGRALLLALIPLLAALGWLHLGWLYLVTVLVGLLGVAFEIASLAFLPSLLSSDELSIGNSRLGTSESLAEIAGPPLAGLLIQLLTAPLAILLDALSFLCSAFCLGLLRVPEHLRAEMAEKSRLWRELGEGLWQFWHNPILRALGGYICTHTFFSGAFAALYLIYAMQLFGTNPLAYSVLVACGGAGALIGSLCANRCARRLGTGRTLIVAALCFGLLSFCTPLASGPAPLIFALMALSQLCGDCGFAIYSISEISLRQQMVPERLLGRVNAGMHILSTGLMPPGALLAGLLSEAIGVRLTLLLGSSGMFLACVWLLFSPLSRKREGSRQKYWQEPDLTEKNGNSVKIETCSDGRKG